MSEKIIAGVSFVIGLVLGISLTSGHYKDQMLEEAALYKEQVKQARAKEAEWQTLANKLDYEYKEKINSIQSDNAILVARLRQQLNSPSRVSPICNSSVQSNGNSREARLSAEVNNLIEFSNECSQRADQLIIQLNALQEWIKSVK